MTMPCAEVHSCIVPSITTNRESNRLTPTGGPTSPYRSKWCRGECMTARTQVEWSEITRRTISGDRVGRNIFRLNGRRAIVPKTTLPVPPVTTARMDSSGGSSDSTSVSP